MKVIFLFVFWWSALQFWAGDDISYKVSKTLTDKEGYRLTLNHPALKKGESNVHYLYERVSEDSTNKEYIIEVRSVLCIDSLCKVVPVRVVWNAYGEYLNYELEEDVQLEKAEGIPFVAEDYKVLHNILSDDESPFRYISYDELTNVSQKVEEGSMVDGISGATAITLEEGETVVGATWTCFTMWHWANGDAVEKIRTYAASRLTIQQLTSLIKSNQRKKQTYAIEEVLKRKNYNRVLLRAISNCIKRFDPDLLRSALMYIEQAPSDIYTSNIQNWYLKISPKQRVLLLNSILKFPTQEPSFYYSLKTDFKNYREIDLFFKLLEEKSKQSEQMINYAFSLLDRDILIARRAYWYLNTVTLTKEQTKALQKFRRKRKKEL